MGASPRSRASSRRKEAMGGFELLAVVVFFLIGYWIVDFFWPKKKAAAESAAAPAVEPWHQILGLSPDASVEQIREAYQRKSAEHHPDKVFNQGPEAREAALRMTRKVNDAFEQAMRERR
jgi:preprotein translocase subunit Sec63